MTQQTEYLELDPPVQQKRKSGKVIIIRHVVHDDKLDQYRRFDPDKGTYQGFVSTSDVQAVKKQTKKVWTPPTPTPVAGPTVQPQNPSTPAPPCVTQEENEMPTTEKKKWDWKMVAALAVLVLAVAALVGNLQSPTGGDRMEPRWYGPHPESTPERGRIETPPAPMHSFKLPVEDPTCAYAKDGMRMQSKPAPNAFRARNPVSGRCTWVVPD